MYAISIQGLVTLVGILCTAFLTYHFSQKKYTHGKLFDRKLNYLEEIYGKIISLEKDLNIYILTTALEMREESLSKKSDSISAIKAKFFDLQEFFWKKEITLDESSVDVIQSFIDISNQLLSELQTSIISQSLNDHQNSYQQWTDAFQTMNHKLAKAKVQLKKDFRKVTEM